MEKKSKERIKELLSRLLQFVISNLAVMLVGFVAMLIVGMFAFDDAVEHRFYTDLVFHLSMLLGLGIPFYHCYFRNHSAYKRFYLKKREEGHGDKAIMGMHMTEFARYELLVLLPISLALSFVPTAVLGKTGIATRQMPITTESFLPEMEAMTALLRGGAMQKTYEEFLLPVFVLTAADRAALSGEWEEIHPIILSEDI